MAMLKSLAVALLALELGAGFGAASAELFSTSSNAMEIELRVEVTQTAETVVAHLSFQAEKPLTLALVARGGGVYGLRTEVAQLNYRVVFEIVGSTSTQSDSFSLTQLGLVFPDAERPTTTSSVDVNGLSEETRGWGWLALALAAAALSALAFWALGGEDESDHRSSETPSIGAEDDSATF